VSVESMPDGALRLATFNVENLFARYRFASGFDPTLDGFTINDLAFEIFNETEKQITGRVVRDLDADILCLVEVENMAILERFNSRYLAKLKYRHRVLIDGNDPRNIDLAVLSRHPVAGIRTNRHLRNAANTAPLFARDCLEVDFSLVDEQSGETKILTVLVNHFKLMMEGRAQTRARRREQVEKVIELLDARFGPGFEGNFAVLGDFNDYMEGERALTGLVDHPAVRAGETTTAFLSDHPPLSLPTSRSAPWSGYWRLNRDRKATAPASTPAPTVESAAHPADRIHETSAVVAPMPGVVIRVLAGEGDRVESRQPLVVLEAMKMETPLVSPYEAVVKRVHVAEGDRVSGGMLLVELED